MGVRHEEEPGTRADQLLGLPERVSADHIRAVHMSVVFQVGEMHEHSV